MTSISGAIIDWWRRRHRNSARINKIRAFPSTAALPKQLGRQVLAIAGDPSAWAVMECPCGHGHRLQVRIRPHVSTAVWSLRESERGPSLSPSIDFESADRRCHFWLDKGRVRWVPE